MSVSTEQVTSFLQIHGDFLVYGTPSNHMVYHGVETLNTLGFWHWIKCFDPNRGFIYSGNNQVSQIGDALSQDDHTGVTFSILMRLLQKIAKKYVKGDGENLECTICENDHYDVETKTTLDCGHMFHCYCIRQWESTDLAQKRCPNCRKTTLPDYK